MTDFREQFMKSGAAVTRLKEPQDGLHFYFKPVSASVPFHIRTCFTHFLFLQQSTKTCKDLRIQTRTQTLGPRLAPEQDPRTQIHTPGPRPQDPDQDPDTRPRPKPLDPDQDQDLRAQHRTQTPGPKILDPGTQTSGSRP